MERKKVTLHTLLKKKEREEPVVFITAYDYPTAKRADRAGVDMILIGDSLGMTVLGYQTTIPVTMDVMIPHAEAVANATQYAFVVGDMPYMSYQTSDKDAIINASRFIKAGCSAVKCEGGKSMTPRIKAMVDSGTLVMGHLGLTPQSMAAQGGYKVQAKNQDQIKRLEEEVLAIKEAGVFSVLLEAVPPEAGRIIKEAAEIPVYGIGAGQYVDGQLLIWHDIMGTFEGKIGKSNIPRFAKRYAEIGRLEEEAVRAYAQEVRDKKFPSEEHAYKMES